jgi:tricorn protease
MSGKAYLIDYVVLLSSAELKTTDFGNDQTFEITISNKRGNAMSKIPFTIVVIILFTFSIFAQSPAANHPLMIGRVSINQTHIAFAHAGKIWLVERQGGAARAFDAAATDNNPIFSPDGKWLAFSRFNGGDFDLYVAPACGGEARRLTFQAEDDFAETWTPDGREIIFQSTRDEEGVERFFKVAADGSSTLEESLPLPQAYNGSFSPDGKQIAYNPRYLNGEWRYYRGGVIAPIYIANLQNGSLEKLPNQNFNDRSPMWIGDKIYFASDRAGTFNLFSYDRKTKQTKQLTSFNNQGVRSVAATSDAIVFVQNGRLNLFDLNTNQMRAVDVSVSPDTSALQPRNANALRFLEHILPSSNADKILLGTRGEVVIFDLAKGESKNLTNSSGVAERYPTISPDGKSIAYFSDESGEYALHIRSIENDTVKKINVEPQPSYYWDLVWSPDSKNLVFADRRLNLWLADTINGNVQKVDASVYSAQSGWQANFSPDSRFLTYAKRLKNRSGTVYIYDPAQKKSFQVTDGVTHTESPVFDANGKYLYFVSSPNAGTSEFEWGVLNSVFARSGVVRRVHALILSKDGVSPLLPNNQPNTEAKISEVTTQTRIDFDNLSKRFIDLPLPQRDYAQITAGANPGKIFLVTYDWSETPGVDGGQPRNRSLYSFDLSKLGEMQKIVDKAGSFDIARNGSKVLFRKGRDWFLAPTETALKPEEGKIDLSKIEIRVNPAEEWRQMFHESARIMRDWFYDPNLHGQNIVALEREYAAYLPTTTRRGDLNALIRQMLGSVSVSHLGVGGGDTTSAGSGGGGGNRTGLLGADYAAENGRVRFRKIYRSTSYSAANGSFSAPLSQPGIDVREGDYLMEVNGNKVVTGKNLFSLFENTIGKPTKIVVSSDARGANSRAFTVYPAAGENRLRRAVWAEENRRKVEQMSGGKLGYIFIEGYGGEGIMNAVRGMNGYADKQGIIIDQRFNGGGITPDYLIEWMQRKPLYHYMFRGGDDIPTPVNPAPPVKVMLINEWNGSAAETGAFMFKLGKVGSLVGKRTIGGGIGPYFFTPRLIDGGQIQLPNRAAYNPDGSSWGIENVGVAPDFDVEITPQDFMAGKDSQLEKAVEVAMAEINKTNQQLPKRPAFPVHPAATIENSIVGASGSVSLPLPGSAFPITQVKISSPSANAKDNGKFAIYIGEYSSPAVGSLIVKQEGDKLFGEPADGGGRMEFAPEKEADKFTAQPIGASVVFVRDTSGKVTGIKVMMPDGREITGNKIK